MHGDYEQLGFVEKLKIRVAYLLLEASKNPWDAAKTIITCMMPLLLLAAVLAYKLQMSLNKQKKLKKAQKKKEKLLQKLKASQKSEMVTIESNPKMIDNEKIEKRKREKNKKSMDEKELLKMAEMVCGEPVEEIEEDSNKHLKSE
ncbi:unnamed protein product, partial [Mesorhabditis belari]|uniref:Small integral membrane protein 15 n=1 Tax=Mesorhabditis belari TaxID=2138241 RepID=A0AAF3EZM6_9BILA